MGIEKGEGLHVWVVSFGEPLPIDGGTPRLRRAGMLSYALADMGHTVTWWASAFDHYAKRKRFDQTTVTTLQSEIQLVCLRTIAYRRNVSIRRIISNIVLGREYRRQLAQLPRPDVIFCAYPTIELLDISVEFGRATGVPVVADVRDLWPDIWLDALPAVASPLVKLALMPFYKAARRALRGATAICGNSEGMVEWGIALAGRGRQEIDRSFPFGYPEDALEDAKRAEATAFWSERLGDDVLRTKFKCCYFGGITTRASLDLVVDAAHRLRADGHNDIVFILCGTGAAEGALRERARGNPNIVFAGWVDGPKLRVLGAHADVGLLPFRDFPDFVRSLPNKVSEYLSLALPIISSLDGEVRALVEAQNCGVRYEANNANDLARVIYDLYCDREKLQRLRVNARTAFEQLFSADVVNEKLIEYLERLTAAGRPRTAGAPTVECAKASWQQEDYET